MEPVGVLLYAPRDAHVLYVFCWSCCHQRVWGKTRLESWQAKHLHFKVKLIYPNIFKDFSQKCGMMDCGKMLATGKIGSNLFPVYPDNLLVLPEEMRGQF
jgi:hypothetical protein